jgi:hypothetical protein
LIYPSHPNSIPVSFFGFIPRDSVQAEGRLAMIGYVAFLLIDVVVFVTVPLIFYHRAVSEKKEAAVRREAPPESGAAVSP